MMVSSNTVKGVVDAVGLERIWRGCRGRRRRSGCFPARRPDAVDVAVMEEGVGSLGDEDSACRRTQTCALLWMRLRDQPSMGLQARRGDELNSDMS